MPTPAEVERIKREASALMAKEALARQAGGEALESRLDPALGGLDIATDTLVARGQAAHDRDSRTRRQAELRKHLGTGEIVLVNDAARDLIQREAWAIEPGSFAFRDLAQRLMRAEVEGLRRAEEQDRGDFTGRPADPAVKAPSPKRVQVHAEAAG